MTKSILDKYLLTSNPVYVKVLNMITLRNGMVNITSRAGVEYFESEYDSSWWKRGVMDNPNTFVGAERNLPKEILKQLSKIRMLKDDILAKSRILRSN